MATDQDPLVNRHFACIEELEDAQAQRCVTLQAQPHLIRSTTLFPWWPQRLRKRQQLRRKWYGRPNCRVPLA